MVMKRQLPKAIPAIHPLPEHLVDSQRLAWYQDMKAVLRMPSMGVVTMAFSHYPNFFAELWRGLRPVCASAPFNEALVRLQEHSDAQAATLAPSSLEAALGGLGYAPGEVDGIRAVLEAFHHSNQAYLLIATLARLLLEGGRFGDERNVAPPFYGEQAATQAAPPVLMEAHHADKPTRELYADIKTTLGVPFVNTEYRALARWPSYFSLAWGSLRPQLHSAPHEALCTALHEEALQLCRHFPNPEGLDAAGLKHAASQDAALAEVLEVSRLFQWLLPGLIINLAYFRAQL